jgi:DNA adenine methylase
VRHYWVSPLRYPGGKAALADFLADLIALQRPRPRVYVEPFAGGAGAALRLLYGEHVDRVVLNDLHPGIAAFWRAVFHYTDELIERIRTCELSIDAWRHYHAQFISGKGSDVDLGFATLYLNRTNRSGILYGRPIGGLRQTGQWKVNARFYRERLAERIKLISSYRGRVQVQQEDALELLAHLDTSKAMLYVDPPYILRGRQLYLNTLTWEDHQRLARLLTERHRRWFLTYNADPRVPEVLYKDLRCVRFSIRHTAAVQHLGSEYAVFSPGLRVGSLDALNAASASYYSEGEPSAGLS